MVVDDTPKKDFRSIGVKLPIPQLKSARKGSSGEGDVSTENDFSFEKPALKKVERPVSERLKSPESDKHFDVSALKSVTKNERERKRSETESEKVFNKPPLRQVQREEAKVMRTSPESEHKFEVPSLKTVQKKHSEGSTSESDKRFDKPVLRAVSVERNDSLKSDESDKTFVKPALRSAPKPYLEKPTTPKSPEAKTFEIPNLRRTPKVDRGQIETSEKPGHHMHVFDKPSLRNVSRPSIEEKDTNGHDTETKYKFEKLALRNVPRDHLPTQTLRGKTELDSAKLSDSDEKHKFDLPALRNVSRETRFIESPPKVPSGETEPVSRLRSQLRATPRKDVSKPVDGDKPEAPSWLKDMKLKKTRSQGDDLNDIGKGREAVPAWSQLAADKRSKMLEVLSFKGILVHLGTGEGLVSI